VRGFIKFQDVRTWGFEETQNTPNSAGSGTVGNLGRVDLLEGYAEVKSFGLYHPLSKMLVQGLEDGSGSMVITG
jgi:hypothetical protein